MEESCNNPRRGVILNLRVQFDPKGSARWRAVTEDPQMTLFHRPRCYCATVILAFALLASASLLAQSASFQGLGDLPGGTTLSFAKGVSADGTVVVGKSSSSNGAEAFRWTAQTGIVGLGDLLPNPPFESDARAISADGLVIAGQGHTTLDAAYRCTTTSGMTELPQLPGGFIGGGGATALSADGCVAVGHDNSANGYEAFRWVAGQGIQGLGDLPGGDFWSEATAVSADGQVVVGYSKTATGNRAFRWEAGLGMVELAVLPGATQSYAWGISADGSVIVGSSNGRPVQWTAAAGMAPLDVAHPEQYGSAYATSPDGTTTVGTATAGACVWDVQHGRRYLADVLTNVYGLDLSGWSLYQACAISSDGLTIVGDGVNPSGSYEGWIARLATRGDLNCDGTYGHMSFADINPFVLYLSNLPAWQATYPNCPPTVGDINGDGTYGYLSFGDINPFVALLSTGN
jgi:probable HAF family extracellular repeat protein